LESRLTDRDACEKDDLESRLTVLVNGIVDWAIANIFRPLLEGVEVTQWFSLVDGLADRPPYAQRKHRSIHRDFRGSERRDWGVCWSTKIDFSTKNIIEDSLRNAG
jgi:hypothetical protein